MKKKKIPAIDGIPGIMPGIGSLLPETEEMLEEKISKHPKNDGYVGRSAPPPQTQRRMMPYNKR